MFGPTDDEADYAPTLQMDTFRTALAVYTGLGDDTEGLDVITAFLLASIGDNVVYVIPPKGRIPRNAHDEKMLREGYCWRLTRAPYGLRKSPRYWHPHCHRTVTKKLGRFQMTNSSVLATRTATTAAPSGISRGAMQQLQGQDGEMRRTTTCPLTRTIASPRRRPTICSQNIPSKR